MTFRRNPRRSPYEPTRSERFRRFVVGVGEVALILMHSAIAIGAVLACAWALTRGFMWLFELLGHVFPRMSDAAAKLWSMERLR